MKHLSNQKGFTILGATIAGAMGIAAFAMASQAIAFSRKQANLLRNKQIAETYVIELVETFRSMTALELARYMETNPVNGAFAPYSLCSHINLIDRDHSVNAPQILNADPNVDLGNIPLSRATASLTPNRFYSIQVINVTANPPALVIAHCNKTLTDNAVVLPNQYKPGVTANERLVVTVGMTWVPLHADTAAGTERITLSTVLPN